METGSKKQAVAGSSHDRVDITINGRDVALIKAAVVTPIPVWLVALGYGAVDRGVSGMLWASCIASIAVMSFWSFLKEPSRRRTGTLILAVVSASALFVAIPFTAVLDMIVRMLP